MHARLLAQGWKPKDPNWRQCVYQPVDPMRTAQESIQINPNFYYFPVRFDILSLEKSVVLAIAQVVTRRVLVSTAKHNVLMWKVQAMIWALSLTQLLPWRAHPLSYPRELEVFTKRRYSALEKPWNRESFEASFPEHKTPIFQLANWEEKNLIQD